ncbi:MAG TPA: hypothetical protein VG797_04120, partial [Phycisphaerales bacterium]|nr:hypothetical protein [Phycisphaerales bacterium]
GMVGERIGELSLLFRWHYFVGASRIIGERWFTGVGPAGFQDAYLLARLAVSPEEVESPHSVFFDLISRLGMGGAAWSGILIASLWVMSRGLSALGAGPIKDEVKAGHAPNHASRHPEKKTKPSRAGMVELHEVVLVVGVPLAAVAASLTVESAMIAGDTLLLRAAAVFGWIAIAFVAARLGERSPGAFAAGLFGAAIALAVHGQIEMTPVIAGSCGLFAAFIALAASGAGPGDESAPPQGGAPVAPLGGRAMGWLALVFAAAWSTMVVVSGVLPSWRWERQLHAAAAEMKPLADVRTALAASSISPNSSAADRSRGAAQLQTAIETLARELGRSTEPTPENMGRAVFELQSRTVDRATQRLEAADRINPGEAGALVRAVRLLMEHALACQATGGTRDAVVYSDRALELAKRLRERFPGRSSMWGREGAIRAARVTIVESKANEMTEAVACFRRSAELDPEGLAASHKLARALAAAGDPSARDAARRTLEIDRNMHLDPLKQLTTDERAEMETLSSGK